MEEKQKWGDFSDKTLKGIVWHFVEKIWKIIIIMSLLGEEVIYAKLSHYLISINSPWAGTHVAIK